MHALFPGRTGHEDPASGERRVNGGEKLVHGSGGIVSLRAEQDSAR